MPLHYTRLLLACLDTLFQLLQQTLITDEHDEFDSLVPAHCQGFNGRVPQLLDVHTHLQAPNFL